MSKTNRRGPDKVKRDATRENLSKAGKLGGAAKAKKEREIREELEQLRAEKEAGNFGKGL